MGIVIDASVLNAWRAYKQDKQRVHRSPLVDYTSVCAAHGFYWSSDDLADSAQLPGAVFVQLTGKDIEPCFLEF